MTVQQALAELRAAHPNTLVTVGVTCGIHWDGENFTQWKAYRGRVDVREPEIYEAATLDEVMQLWRSDNTPAAPADFAVVDAALAGVA